MILSEIYRYRIDAAPEAALLGPAAQALEEGSVVGILGEVALLKPELQLVGAHICQHGVIGYDAVFC